MASLNPDNPSSRGVRRDVVLNSARKTERDVLPNLDQLNLSGTRSVLPKGSVGVSDQLLPRPAEVAGKVYFSDGRNWIELAAASKAGAGLSDARVGPNEDYTTVAEAFAAGIGRIRVVGDTNEPANTTIVVPAYTHVWIDAPSVVNVPPTTNFDISGTLYLNIEGNTTAQIAHPLDPGSPVELFEGAPADAEIRLRRVRFDLTGGSATTGPFRIGSETARWDVVDASYEVPAITDMELLSPKNPLSSYKLLRFEGEATRIMSGLVRGDIDQVFFKGYGAGDRTFANPYIDLSPTSELRAKQWYFEEAVEPDVVIGGGRIAEYRELHALNGGLRPAMRVQGDGVLVERSEAEYLEANTLMRARFQNLLARELDLSDTGSSEIVLSGGEYGDGACPMTIAADRTRFTDGVTLVPPLDATQTGGISVTAAYTEFASVFLKDGEADETKKSMTITGTGTRMLGLTNIGAGYRDVDSSGGTKTEATSVNLLGTSGSGKGGGLRMETKDVAANIYTAVGVFGTTNITNEVVEGGGATT